MGYYMDYAQSIKAYEGGNPRAIISSLAYRFVGQNLKHGLYYRAYTKKGILRTADYRYKVDFNGIFPDALDASCVWAFSKYYCGGDSILGFDVNCLGPLQIYVNGEKIFQSDLFKERYSEQATRVNLPLKAGINDIRMRFQKTKAGFGGQFGTWIGKWDYYMLMPTAERDGMEGWVFTEPVGSDYEPECYFIGMSEADMDVKLYPDIKWKESDAAKGQMMRMYGADDGYAVGWTRGFFGERGQHEYSFDLETITDAAVYIDGVEVYSGKGGKFTARLGFGRHNIFVKVYGAAEDWGFELKCEAVLENPANLKGADDKWIYIGCFDRDFEFPFESAMTLKCTVGEPKRFWRVDLPDTVVRPYNENGCFGNWSYPLGVTLYGLLHTAIEIGSEDIKEYIREHMQLCVDTFEYAIWEKEQCDGVTAIHNLLSSIDSLDDCGSFSSALLEAMKYLDIKNADKLLKYVGDYISEKQTRLPDGSFFRKKQLHSFHNMTMWADDLYMSVPFLTRYYQYTGDIKYAEDAARQFIGFKKRLFIPEKGIMSHVYDFKYEKATGVPWGRGNGWVVFSLTELLAVLPEDNELRGELIEFLNTLCSSYLKLQDDKGMWHQVLTDPEAYPETSCTAMFIYAFARGVRYGWLKEPEKYIKAVMKGWAGLAETSVDHCGNVYGVCRGSEFSFLADYYKYELGWNLNDTHGTGIVMLAGLEVIRLERFLQ